MFLVNPPGQAFHDRVVDLIYKLIFHGLKHLDFNNISYFALVFSAQMLVLEYYQEHAMQQKMIHFLLYRYLPFYVISELHLNFDSIFCQVSPHDENTCGLNKPIQNGNLSQLNFGVLPSVNLERLSNQIDTQISSLLNQMVFCRTCISDALVQVKVMDRMRGQKVVDKEELKKRFLRIEELRERRVTDILLMQSLSSLVSQNMHTYKDLTFLKNRLVGGEFYL
jgi:hypothetical protein